MRDPETGNSKGFAFINFASFEASDAAMDAMNGQYLCNRPITVSYAFKKDSKGERHGSAAERLLAAQNPLSHADRPHQLFADAPVPMMGNPMMPPHPMMPPPPPPATIQPPQFSGKLYFTCELGVILKTFVFDNYPKRNLRTKFLLLFGVA